MLEYLQQNSGLLLLAGLALVTTSLMMRLAKRRREGQEHLTFAERTERLRQQRAMRGDLEELMVEIEQMAKRLAAQLDAKTIHLERLIEEADHKIAQLQAASRAGTPMPEPRADVLPPPAMTSAPVSPAPEPTVPPAPSRPAEPEDRVTASVYRLADQGLDPLTIARELNEHVGKVELILALRKA